MATMPSEKAALAASEAAKARKFERCMKSMKKAVLEVQLILLDGVDTDQQLHAAGRILSQVEHADVVEERYIAKVCGYARCSNGLSLESARKGRYRISLAAKKVYDLEESRRFCSSACLVASKDFGSKLPVRQDAVESRESLVVILAAVRGAQYAARSKPMRLKEDSVVKSPARTKCGKLKPKEANIGRPASSDVGRSVDDDRGPSDTAVSSTESSAGLTGIAAETGVPAGVFRAGSGLNVKGSSIAPQVEQNNSTDTSSNPSSSFQSTPVARKTLGVHSAISTSSSKGPKLRSDRASLTSALISSTVQTNFEKLTIQERVGDQTVLPLLDYEGSSDAIEGFVPSRPSRAALAEPRVQSKNPKRTNSSDIAVKSGQHDDHHSSSERIATGKEARIMLGEEVEGSERSSGGRQDGAVIFKETEGLVSASPQADGSKWCITEMDNETSFSHSTLEFIPGDTAPSTSKGVQESPANLKPALKKQFEAKPTTRTVAWADKNTTKSQSRNGNTKSKDRALSTSSSDDLFRVEKKINSLKLEEEQLPITRLSKSILDLATAAGLASVEATATVLTEASTSAANLELDGCEAVAQSGTFILSATHQASVSPHEVHAQSGTFDEDESYARAAQAREEMRRLRMPRKYSGLQDEKDGDDDGDDSNPVVNEDDDSDDATGADGNDTLDHDDADDDDDDDDGNDTLDHDDADDDDDDDDNDDDDNISGGIKRVHEVLFAAPPKGFKAEVSIFGTMFMAVEGWISAATVAYIYGKEPHQEDDFLSLNGREYSRHAVSGDGVSAEILRTFSLCVSRALPGVVRALRISVPLSTLELSLGRLIKTLNFVEALPPFGIKQWRVLAILLLDSLSIQRVPRLRVYFSNNRSMMCKVLDSTRTSEAEYDVFRDVVLPLGRSPTFSTLSGG